VLEAEDHAKRGRALRERALAESRAPDMMM
jgi:hypothetical protein